MEAQVRCTRCGEMAVGKFCSSCGARMVPENQRDLFKELMYAVTDLEKRFFYTLKVLLKNPKQIIEEYLSGERAKYFPPIRLFMITLVLGYFWFSVMEDIFTGDRGMYHYLKETFSDAYKPLDPKSDKVFSLENFNFFYDEFMKLMNLFYKFLSALAIPVSTLVTYFVYRAKRWSFVSHLVMNTYLVSMQSLLSLALSPFLVFLPINVIQVGYVGFIPIFLYNVYTHGQLLKGEKSYPYLRSTGVSISLIILYSLANMIFGMILVMYIQSHTGSFYISPNQ